MGPSLCVGSLLVIQTKQLSIAKTLMMCAKQDSLFIISFLFLKEESFLEVAEHTGGSFQPLWNM